MLNKELDHKYENSVQDVNTCGPMADSCYRGISTESFGCKPSCKALYADVRFTDESSTAAQWMVAERFRRLTDLYDNYKNKIARNLEFSQSGNANQSESMLKNWIT